MLLQTHSRLTTEQITETKWITVCGHSRRCNKQCLKMNSAVNRASQVPCTAHTHTHTHSGCACLSAMSYFPSAPPVPVTTTVSDWNNQFIQILRLLSERFQTCWYEGGSAVTALMEMRRAKSHTQVRLKAEVPFLAWLTCLLHNLLCNWMHAEVCYIRKHFFAKLF